MQMLQPWAGYAIQCILYITTVLPTLDEENRVSVWIGFFAVWLFHLISFLIAAAETHEPAAALAGRCYPMPVVQ